MRVKPRLNQALKRCPHGERRAPPGASAVAFATPGSACQCAPGLLIKRAQKSGTTVIATTYDANRDRITERASAANRNLLTPYRKVTGKKTTAVVKVAASTGIATSLPPRSAATSGASPSSRWR